MIRLQPRSAYGYGNRALILGRLGRYQDAVGDFSKALEFDKASSVILEGRGRAYLALGKYSDAIADYERAQRLAPDNSDILAGLGLAYQEQGELPQAFATYNQLIALRPRDPYAYSERCLVRAKQNVDLSRALSDCETAVKLDPKSINARANRAFLYLRLARWKDAEADYTSVLNAQPSAAAWLVGRGFARLRLGSHAGGKADIARAGAIDRGALRKFSTYGFSR